MTDLTPEQVADGWIAHGGGEAPLRLSYTQRVQVMFRDGRKCGRHKPYLVSLIPWEWADLEPHKDLQIIAYKPEQRT